MPSQPPWAGALRAGCLVGLADAAMAIGRSGHRLDTPFARAACGLSLAAVVAVAVTAAVMAGATVPSVLRRAFHRASERVTVIALRGVGLVAGLGLGLAAFSGSGVRRLGLRTPAVVVTMVAAAWLAGWLASRRTRWVGLSTTHRTAVHGLLAAAGITAWGVHATVLVRLYPGLHAILAVTAVACAGVVSVQGTSVGRTPGRPWVLTGAFMALALAGLLGGRALARSQPYRTVVRQSAPLGRYALAVLARRDRRAQPAPTVDDVQAVHGPHVPLRNHDLVLITVDALRADRLRALGGRGRMPTLDAIAAQSVVFGRAYCTTPHTSYSLASVMLGKYARSVLALPVQHPQRTLAERLADCGYSTAGFYPPAVFSVDADRFGDLRARAFGFAWHREGYADARDRVHEVASWLGTQRRDQRLFVWVHLFEPHEPYLAHTDHAFGNAPMDRYDAEVAAADDAIAELRGMFARAGRRPVWVITADHGEEFGEHGGSFHGTSLYDEQVHVPLVLDAPGVPPRVVRAPVSLVDIVPTVLAGVGVDRPPGLRGADLGPLASGQSVPTRVFASTGSLRMVVEDHTKLIVDLSDGDAERYDLDADPGENHNTADEDPGTTARLRGLIEAWEASHARYEAETTGRRTVATDAGTDADDEDLPELVNRAIQGDRSVADAVAGLLRATTGTVRVRTARVLGDLGLASPVVLSALSAAMGAGDPALAREAGLSLSLLCDRRGHAAAQEALHAGDRDVTRRAALGLARLGDAAGVAVLGAWLLDPYGHESARDDAVAALRALRSPAAFDTWSALLSDMRLAPQAAEALGELGDPRAAPLLAAVAARPTYPLTVRAAVDALVTLGTPDAADRVAEALVVTDPLPDAWTLVRRVGEPGHRIAGHAGTVRVGPRGVRVVTGAVRGYRRAYLVTRTDQDTVVSVGPYGVEVPVPAGDHQVAVTLDPARRVTHLYLSAPRRVDVRGVILR